MFMDIVRAFAIWAGEAHNIVHDVENRNWFPVARIEFLQETSKANVQINARQAKIQTNIKMYRTDLVANLTLGCTGEGCVTFEYDDSRTDIMQRRPR